jgi:hypothetical protein
MGPWKPCGLSGILVPLATINPRTHLGISLCFFRDEIWLVSSSRLRLWLLSQETKRTRKTCGAGYARRMERLAITGYTARQLSGQ